ncbi:MAG TPA: hypothetical protein PKC97_06500 [Burkholderiaceae bacterium]|nr:hypothetical protein [Burkholderiaceae bacterium]
MTTCFIPWADLAFEQVQAWQRTAFFMLGCIEREHLVALRALGMAWPGVSGGVPDDAPPVRLDIASTPAASRTGAGAHSANAPIFDRVRLRRGSPG